MTDFDPELKLVHAANSNNFDVNIRLEITGVALIPNKVLHFPLQQLNVREGGSEVDGQRDALMHSIRTGEIVDPQCVENTIWTLSDPMIVYASENCEQKRDPLDDKVFLVDCDTVTNIEWMLHEQEDAGTQDFLSGC